MLVETADEVFVHDVSLPKSATFFPIGFPVEIRTNSDAVLRAASESWSSFEQTYAEAPIVLSLAVTDVEQDRAPQRPQFRSHLHLMSIVSDAHNQVLCDLSRGCASGWITRRVAEDTAVTRLRFMESSVMMLLVQAHLAPMHSALIAKNGIGVALCGESFAGKSTLSYACARSGWTYITDDGAYLVRKDRNRYAAGNPHIVRFRADAKDLFPELERFRVARRVNGKQGIEVRTSELGISTAAGCAIDHLVFIRRSRTGPPGINPSDPAKALHWLESAACYGSEEVRAAQRQAYRRLVDAHVWELRYSDLSDAIQMLNGLGA